MRLHYQFAIQARKHKSKLAFIDCATQRKVSYGQALIGALILAARFRRLPGRYVGILLPNSAGCGVTILGVLFAGKIPVMINYSTGVEENIRHARHTCGFDMVVTARPFLEKIDCPESGKMLFVEELLQGAGAARKLAALTLSKMPLPVLCRHHVGNGSDQDTALILFTSGSEKAPKAVQLSHKNISSNLHGCAELFQVSENDIMLSVLPLFHVFGQTTTFWLPLCYGMTVVTYPSPLEFRTIARIIREQEPTLLVGTPYFLDGYVRQSAEGDFKSLRLAVAGADKLPERIRRAYLDKHDVEIFEGYGATETSPVISANFPGDNCPGSIGRPLPGVEVRIADLDSGESLPPGREGKILVRGDLVMKGYLGDVEETALRIEGGWYETGDMGIMDKNGRLWHRGRLKRFIKIGGEMVSLVAVEEAVSEVLPEDVDYCAVEVADSRRGACVGLAVSQPQDKDKLVKKLEKKLPSLAMPRHIIVIEELPKMGSGKIDFRKTQALVTEQLNG